jgi:tetratricopeptide (TPR) repeat protein
MAPVGTAFLVQYNTMPKTGRNEPCPCGSGKKFKHCCMAQDQAEQHLALAAQRAKLEQQSAQHSARMRAFKASLYESDQLDQDSNAVIGLIDAGRLDEAEAAARELLLRYPDVHDGHDRLGMVYEARGLNREAAQCYRQVVEFMRAAPQNYDPEIMSVFVELIARLDPPTPSA